MATGKQLRLGQQKEVGHPVEFPQSPVRLVWIVPRRFQSFGLQLSLQLTKSFGVIQCGTRGERT